MKFAARILIFLIFLITGFLFLSPQKVLAGAFDFDLDKWVETRVSGDKKEEESEGKEIPVSTERLTPYDIQNKIAAGADLFIVMDERLNKGQVRAVPALAQIMSKFYEYPPASAMAYTYDLLHNSGLITKPVYAQGIGFAGLAPLLPLWKASRNISYAVLIIVMVAIGFMVIFRMKIDPKTVISVQAAIPKIIAALLLITFSYPIAGFMIDVMYLSIFVVVEILSKAIPPDLPGWADFMTDTPNQQQAFIQTGLAGIGNLFTSVFSFGLIPAFFQQFFGGSAPTTGVLGGGGLLLAKFITIWGAGTFFAGAIPATIVGLVAIPVIILFIIGLGLFFTFIRLTFLLLNSYIQLLLAVILGPILLLREAIPGQSAFGDWLKNIMANLVVFPATVAVIYFSWIITAVTFKGNLWGAPLTPTGGGGDTGGKGNPVSLFIGLGIIFIAPNLVASVKKMFGAKPPIPVTAGSAFSPLTGGAAALMGAASQFYYIQSLTERGAGKALVDKGKTLLGIGKGGGGDTE